MMIYASNDEQEWKARTSWTSWTYEKDHGEEETGGHEDREEEEPTWAGT